MVLFEVLHISYEVSQENFCGQFLVSVGEIGNFELLVLVQISNIFTIFHSFYLSGGTTKYCG